MARQTEAKYNLTPTPERAERRGMTIITGDGEILAKTGYDPSIIVRIKNASIEFEKVGKNKRKPVV